MRTSTDSSDSTDLMTPCKVLLTPGHHPSHVCGEGSIILYLVLFTVATSPPFEKQSPAFLYPEIISSYIKKKKALLPACHVRGLRPNPPREVGMCLRTAIDIQDMSQKRS